MTSVEKRRSSRKSGGHRKHSDGGFSDTSSGGSFLDETDREVSNLTDRAFRSLCIGDEAVYNDSDLSLSSPSTHSDRQLAFCRGSEERETDDRKRAAQENFNLRVQQYGQDWITEGMYGAEIHRDPQWGACGERTQGMVSATFQHSLVETSQLGKSLMEEEMSFLSNGATELSSQQRRSHSRVSSLIRAFDSDGHRDGAGMDHKIKEQDDGTSWDKSALMSIQRELSEFSYQQNFNSHNFHPAGPFSSQDANFYSSEAETMAQISHSYMRSSQTKHSMSSQVNCRSNFFIHSELSPFRLWRDYNRFPFQQGEATGFMHYSEFPKWYQTPMYNEPSFENQPYSHHRDFRHPKNHLGYPAPLTAPRSISTSSQLQRASAVEKRCESELTVHHPHRKWTKSLGTNKLPSHRPSTASPSTEMSRRVRDTISSVKALQQKVKMMSEHDMTNQQGVFSRNESWIHPGNNALTVEANVVSSNTVNPFRMSQLLTPAAHQHPAADTSRLHQHDVSPQPVEHPPVRAESRGATPDIRMSSYRSRATSLLFNLKDNRKRVKSTYSPTKFKGFDTAEKNQQPSIQEPDSEIYCLQLEVPKRTNTAVNQYHTSGLSLTTQTSHPARVNTGQYPENTASNYQAAQMQGQMGYSSEFSGFVPSNYSNNQVAGNGQNLSKTLASFTPYRQDIHGSAEEVMQSHSAADTARLNLDNNQYREYLIGKGKTSQAFNETTGRVITKVDMYEQLNENKHDYKNVSLQENWRQKNSQDTENTHFKTNVSPVKQETISLIESLKQENMHDGMKEPVKKVDLTLNYNRFTDQYGRGQQNLFFTSDKPMKMIKTGQIIENIPVLNEKKHIKPNPTSTPSTVSLTNQVKNTQTVDTKCEQVMASLKKPQYPQAELAKTLQKAHADPPKTESAEFTSAGQSGLETVKMHEFKSEPTELQNIRQVKEDHIIKIEERKDQHKEKLRDKCFQPKEEKQIKAEKERVQKQTDEPKHVTEKVPKKLKTEQVETEELKEEHIKTELAKTEAPKWVRINQVKHEQASGVHAEEKQQGTEKAGGEQMEAEKIKMEKVKADIRGEQREQIKEPQNKIRDMKRMEVEVLEVRTDHMKVEDVREAKVEKESSQTHQIHLEKATSSPCSTEKARAEKAKLEKNPEQKESGLSKTENLLERSAKLSAKLASKQQVRQEPDRVEQVKTELAKAKAELAKIKEKMRGEQKEKVRNILFTEEVTLKNDDPINTHTGSKNQNHPAEMQTHAVVNDYERLREKYGFTHAVSANSTKVPVTENVPPNDANQIKAGTGNNFKSIDGRCLNDLFLTPETENKESVTSFKHSEETGSQCDHRESLNTPQLSRSHCDKANRGNEAEKLKDNTGQKFEKCDAIKDTASLQKGSVSVKHERKSSDQHMSRGKDMAVSPPRALSQKEKAQTKQEILTSKIKAHAEKEISAIKEKGFALPEGFIGKSSAKQLVSGHSFNIRQRPYSQEVPKKHESTVSNKITTKHHVESSEVPKELAKFASPLSSDTAGGGATADHSQKPTSTIQPTGTIMSSAESCMQKEPEILQQKEANNIETSRKQNREKQQVVNDETLTRTKEDLAQCSSISKPVTTEDTKTKEEAHIDLGQADCVNQKEPSVTDDSVQIMGIMVTVVERKPTVNNAEKQTIEAEIEGNKSGKENPSQEEAEVLVKAKDSKKSQFIMKEDEATLGKNNYSENVEEAFTLEVINREVTAEMADLQLNRQTEAVAESAKDKLLVETQLVHHQMGVTLEETKDVTVTIPKENLSESPGQTKRGDEEYQQKMQKPLMNEISHDKVNKAENDQPVKDDMTTGKNLSKCSNKDGPSAPLPEDDICPSTSSSSFSIGSPKYSPGNETRCVSQILQTNETYVEEHSQEDTSVHINNIAIRVVPAGGKKDIVNILEKCDIKAIPSNMESAYEQKQVATFRSEGKAKISNNGHCSENLIQAKSEQKMKDSLEEKLAAQYLLSSMRKLSDSLKADDKQNNANTTSKCIKAEDKKSESSVQLVETEYFQVQGLAETSNMSHNNITAKNDSKGTGVLELLPKKTFIGNELHKEQKSEVFVFTVDPSERKADQSTLTTIQDENLTRKNLETKDNTVALQQTGGSMESWNNNKKLGASQSNPTRKHNEENQCDLSAMERQNSSNQHLTNTHLAQETSEIKPKAKEQVSAIPEISAIADYARLKVIVSEDKEVLRVQQFPPNKKEGFFPLIQTRHSRCPVFTDDLQDLSVKTQSLPKEKEINTTANKEPKLLVFPIMEKEHQRTGMFKLGDKERQEKINAKMNICLSDNNESHVNQIDTNKSSTAKTEVEAEAAQEQQGMAAEVEQQRKFAHEEQQKREGEEQQKRAAQMEIQSRLAEEEQRRKASHEEQQKRVMEERQKRAAKVEQQSRITEEEQRRKAAHEEQQRRAAEEQQSKLAEEEQQRNIAHKEKQRREIEEQQRRLAEEEQRRKAAHEKQQRRAAEEQQRRLAEEEQQRKVALEEQRRREVEEQQKRAAQMKIQRRLAEEEQIRQDAYVEQQRREAQERQRRAAELEQQRRLTEEEQKRKAAHEEEQQRRAAEEQQKRAAQVEQHRQLAEEEQKRKVAHEELQRREVEDQQRRAAQLEKQRRLAEEEQKRKAAHEEQLRREVEDQQRRAAQLEKQRRLAEEEQKRKAAHEEQLRREVEEQQRRAAHMEIQRRLAEEEQRRKSAHDEKQKREAEEKQKRAAQLEQQRRIEEEEQIKKAAQGEQQRRAAEEQQRRASELGQQRRLAEEEHRRKAAHEEQQRRAIEEQQKRDAQMEHHRRLAEEEQRRREVEEQQRRAAQIEIQKRLAEEEQRRQDAHEEQQRRVTEEQQKRDLQVEQHRRLAEEEQKRRKVEEQQKRAEHLKIQKRLAEEEQRRQDAHEEQQSREAVEKQNEQQRKATEEKQRRPSQLEQTEEEHEQQRKTAQEEKQRRKVKEQQQRVARKDKQRVISPEEQTRRDIDEQERKAAHNEQQRKAAHEEQLRRASQEEQDIRDLEEHCKKVAQEKQQRITSLIEEQRQVKQVKEQIVAHNQKETKGKPKVVLASEKGSIKQMQEHIKMQHQTEEPTEERLKEEEKTTSQKKLENENKTAEKEKIMREKRVEKHLKHESVKAQELTLTKTDDIQLKKIKGDEQLASLIENARDLHMQMEKRAAQKTDALQYYAITSTNREKRPGDGQLPPPLPLQQQNRKQMELESPNDLLYHTRPYRPAAAASPAPSLPRSNTSSPALGAKPLMFRVKDNTNRCSSFTKSVKPRFHKNFGEDFLMGSTLDGGPDKTEEDQEIIRRNAGTPLNRFAAISEPATFLSLSSSQDYSNSIPHLRPYSRRSMAVDDDESRSIISNVSEDVESFATSAADLTDMHGLFDFDRPESACSFRSDVSRSLGKPPTVPPKSEKALRRAQRLTSRRIKKELSKAAAGSPTGVGKEVSSFPSSSSSSNEVCSSNHHAVASPHFSPPVAFALAPAVGSSLLSPHKDHKSSHCSLHASPHATGPISIPSSSPHAGSAVSLHASSPASKPAALQNVAHVSSSPTLHHVNHPATPVKQYHVESTNYPQSYPLTQRKVLQDLGSGQYFVVDVPVQVKTKTFFDPETGKYVQLNVRQTGQNISQPQLQQAYQQPQVQPQMQIKQQPISSVASVASKPLRFYQGYHSPSQNYQTAVVNSVHPSSSSIPATLHQNQQVSRESHSYGNPVPGVDQNSEGHRYSPEKTPYMDTVNDITKTYNLVNSTPDACNSSLECDTNSQLGRSSVCENDLSANSEYQPRDIIAISELEDFMEVCDW